VFGQGDPPADVLLLVTATWRRLLRVLLRRFAGNGAGGSRRVAGCTREPTFHEQVCAGTVRVPSDFPT